LEKTETPTDLRWRLGDGRQYGTRLDDIKENHRRRYNWAADRLRGKSVVDAGCGVGYGSWILGEHCTQVAGLDFNPDLITVAADNWGRPNVVFRQFNLQSGIMLPQADALVAFEVIEHLATPEALLCSVAQGSFLFGSVPNHDFAPRSIVSNPFHIRHYTYADIETVLSECGFRVTAWYHQGLTGEICMDQEKAKTILFTAERTIDRRPREIEWTVVDVLQFELLRRCNVINDIKDGNRKHTRGPTAF